MDITGHSDKVWIRTLSLRAKKVRITGYAGVKVRDATSVAAHGEREASLPGHLIGNVDAAQTALIQQLSRQGAPEPGLWLMFRNPSATLVSGLDIPSRVTVTNTNLGITTKVAYVEHESHHVAPDGTHTARYGLKVGEATVSYWVLGTSILGTSTIFET